MSLKGVVRGGSVPVARLLLPQAALVPMAATAALVWTAMLSPAPPARAADGLTITITPAQPATLLTPGGCPDGNTSYCYDHNPASAQAPVSVTWQNNSTALHQLTGTQTDNGSKPPLTFHADVPANSSSVAVPFGSPASYSYYCTIHSGMQGTLQIKAPPSVVPGPTPGHEAGGSAGPGLGPSGDGHLVPMARPVIAPVPPAAATGQVSVPRTGPQTPTPLTVGALASPTPVPSPSASPSPAVPDTSPLADSGPASGGQAPSSGRPAPPTSPAASGSSTGRYLLLLLVLGLGAGAAVYWGQPWLRRRLGRGPAAAPSVDTADS